MSEAVNHGHVVSTRYSAIRGAFTVLIGAPLLLLGLAGIAKSAWSGIGNDTLFFIVLGGLIGFFCTRAGWRIICGSQRGDANGLSPGLLGIGAAYFLCAFLICVSRAEWIEWSSLSVILELSFYIVAAGACIAMAKRRHVRRSVVNAPDRS